MSKKHIETIQECTPAEKQPIVVITRLPERIMPEMSFDQWWEIKRQQYGLKPEMKIAIQRHFEAKGTKEYKDFDRGLVDFGIK
jgi:hypothetical protein